MKNSKITIFSIFLVMYCYQPLLGQPNLPQPENRPVSVFKTVVPKSTFDIVLARPTNNSIMLSVLFYKTMFGFVEYWITDKRTIKVGTFTFNQNEPAEIPLTDLQPNTRYFYRLSYRQSDNSEYSKSQIFHFQTQRNFKDNFSFTITADSHLDENTDTLTYKTTLQNAAADSADFHIDLGDTFMTDKYRSNYKESLNQYIAQRYYFGLLCPSSPLFFVLGNHDGESGQRLNGKEDNMTVWSNLTRKKYFPNPVPNDFYFGNNTEEPFVGLPQNYYAWSWGNAQFIVLDPFWYTPRAGTDDPWERTLDKKQYDWLKRTLEQSKATFKFVFVHNLVGGTDKKGRGRGGVEVAKYYEWGGKNSDGTEGFKTHRSDWELPIHDLLVKNKVTAVFHGHDHLFAKQELDGIVYQCISQPGGKEHGNTRNAEEYGYLNGKIMNEPGYMRVKVLNEKVLCEFISTENLHKSVVYSCEIKK
jgi:predicted phosphodiesterase